MLRVWQGSLTVVLSSMLLACGGLKYSEISSSADQYRPRSVAILPTNVGSYEQARGIVERQVAKELIDRQWFEKVVDPGVVQYHIAQDAGLRNKVASYLVTLQTMGQSDRELSGAIGRALGVEALIVANVEYWGYTREKDDKVGKVALGVKYIECGSGTILWKAGHEETEDYLLLKPELSEISVQVVADILDEMPH